MSISFKARKLNKHVRSKKGCPRQAVSKAVTMRHLVKLIGGLHWADRYGMDQNVEIIVHQVLMASGACELTTSFYPSDRVLRALSRIAPASTLQIRLTPGHILVYTVYIAIRYIA